MSLAGWGAQFNSITLWSEGLTMMTAIMSWWATIYQSTCHGCHGTFNSIISRRWQDFKEMSDHSIPSPDGDRCLWSHYRRYQLLNGVNGVKIEMWWGSVVRTSSLVSSCHQCLPILVISGVWAAQIDHCAVPLVCGGQCYVLCSEG